jgi:type IV secretory pathway VirB10-like protein
MASSAGIFFAGVGTTFIILGAGFGGGLMMATSALKEPTEYQNRAAPEPPSPARVILPSTAEAAQPPQPSQHIATAPEPPPPPLQPVKGAQAPVERQVENVDTRKAEAEQRERRKRYAERKAKRQAERAKRQQQIEQGEHQEAPIMASGGDEPRRSRGFGFFGN